MNGISDLKICCLCATVCGPQERQVVSVRASFLQKQRAPERERERPILGPAARALRRHPCRCGTTLMNAVSGLQCSHKSMVAGILVVSKVSFLFKELLTSKQGAHRRGRREDGLKGGHEKHPLKERWTRNIITERVSGTRNTRRPNVRKGKARPPLVHAQVCDFFHFVARFAKGSVTRVQNTILSDVLLIIEPLSLTYTK